MSSVQLGAVGRTMNTAWQTTSNKNVIRPDSKMSRSGQKWAQIIQQQSQCMPHISKDMVGRVVVILH